MNRKTKISYSPSQKLEYAKLMVEENCPDLIKSMYFNRPDHH